MNYLFIIYSRHSWFLQISKMVKSCLSWFQFRKNCRKEKWFASLSVTTDWSQGLIDSKRLWNSHFKPILRCFGRDICMILLSLLSYSMFCLVMSRSYIRKFCYISSHRVFWQAITMTHVLFDLAISSTHHLCDFATSSSCHVFCRVIILTCVFMTFIMSLS